MADRKKITSSGMKDLKSYNVKEGRTYYMGASSSPKYIYVEEVTPNKIHYRVSPFYPENKKTVSRDIGEDLINQGSTRMSKNKYRSQYVGKKVDLKDIQRRRIKFKIKEGSDLSARDVERKYRQKYGLETNMGSKGQGFKTTVNWSNVSKIRDLPDIRVLESKKPKR